MFYDKFMCSRTEELLFLVWFLVLWISLSVCIIINNCAKVVVVWDIYPELKGLFTIQSFISVANLLIIQRGWGSEFKFCYIFCLFPAISKHAHAHTHTLPYFLNHFNSCSANDRTIHWMINFKLLVLFRYENFLEITTALKVKFQNSWVLLFKHFSNASQKV